MLIALAVIAPVWSAGPNAVAHCPTAMAADVAEAFLVNVVFDVKVTVDLWVLVGLELGLFVVLVLDGLGGRTGTVPLTTKVDPEIEVTVPNAVEKKRGAPEGSDLLGNVSPGGRNRPKPPAPALPPPANRPNPPPRVHDPVEFGWVIDTVVAVKCFPVDLVDLVDLVLLVAVTQSPTARSDEGMVSVWVKVVAGVQLTVTWPLAGFCTSIEIAPTRAAMVPEAVDTDGTGFVVGVVVFGCVVAASADPTIAATLTTRASPSPKAALRQRDARRGPLESSRIKTAI